jgi:hypothetical protein
LIKRDEFARKHLEVQNKSVSKIALRPFREIASSQTGKGVGYFKDTREFMDSENKDLQARRML